MKLTAVLLAGAVLAGCAAERRPDRSLENLLAARRADDAARTLDAGRFIDAILKRTEGKAQAAAKAGPGAAAPTVDLLVISGGGDWGAFGAGVLKGWGRAQGELARPQFDVVTGVSTGALIAPFAFLGDEASIERVVQLYRNPQPDTAVSRGLLFFLPGNPSLYELPGLERELRSALDAPMLARLAAQE